MQNIFQIFFPKGHWSTWQFKLGLTWGLGGSEDEAEEWTWLREDGREGEGVAMKGEVNRCWLARIVGRRGGMQSRTPTEPFTKSGHSPLEPIGPLPPEEILSSVFNIRSSPFSIALVSPACLLYPGPLKNSFRNDLIDSKLYYFALFACRWSMNPPGIT